MSQIDKTLLKLKRYLTDKLKNIPVLCTRCTIKVPSWGWVYKLCDLRNARSIVEPSHMWNAVYTNVCTILLDIVVKQTYIGIHIWKEISKLDSCATIKSPCPTAPLPVSLVLNNDYCVVTYLCITWLIKH